MKKAKLMIIGILLVIPFMFIQNVHAADKKINVYLFRGEGCPHCEEAIEWFEGTLAKDSKYKDYYNLVQYEVWYDENNSKLMSDVASKLGTEASGVPFIVIGKKYFSGFAAGDSPKQIKSAIKEQYNNESYVDIVNSVKKGIKIDKEEENSVLPIVIVSAIAIVSVLGLIFFTKEK